MIWNIKIICMLQQAQKLELLEKFSSDNFQ